MDTAEPQAQGGWFRISRGWLLRMAGSSALLALTLMLLPTDKVASSLGRLDGGLFAQILVLFLLSHVCAATKWWFLLGRGLSLLSAIRAHFVGLAANLCLPGVAGGDVVRAGLVAREVGDHTHLVTVSLTDRLVDTLALGLLSVAGLLLFSEDLLSIIGIEGVSSDTVLITAGGIVVAGLTAGFAVLPWIATLLDRTAQKRGENGGLVAKIATTVAALATRRRALFVALAASLAIQFAIVMLAVMLAEGLGVEAPLAVWLFAWPLAKILAVAPISLGGIGVREASLAGLMAPFGADPAGVVAASLIWQGVLFVTGALGAAAWLISTSVGKRA